MTACSCYRQCVTACGCDACYRQCVRACGCYRQCVRACGCYTCYRQCVRASCCYTCYRQVCNGEILGVSLLLEDVLSSGDQEPPDEAVDSAAPDERMDLAVFDWSRANSHTSQASSVRLRTAGSDQLVARSSFKRQSTPTPLHLSCLSLRPSVHPSFRPPGCPSALSAV